MRIKSLLLVFILLIPSGFVEINSDNQEEENLINYSGEWDFDTKNQSEHSFMPDLESSKNASKLQILEKADFWLNQEIVIPQTGGNWTHYFTCDDGNRLEYNSSDTFQYWCESEQKWYSGDQYETAWAAFRHREIISTAGFNLALAFDITKHYGYAESAKDILVQYATLYPSLEAKNKYNTSYGNVAKLSTQSLDEAVLLIDLAWTYQLIKNICSLNEQQVIEEDLLIAGVQVLQLESNLKKAPISNWYSYHNAAIMMVGSTLGNMSLIDEALNGTHGFKFQLANGVFEDGLWHEGSISYHNYTLNSMLFVLESGRKVGLDLYNLTVVDPQSNSTRTVKEMFLAPLGMVRPDGFIPRLNDDIRGTNLHDMLRIYELANLIWEDEVFDWALTKSLEIGERKGWPTYLWGYQINSTNTQPQSRFYEESGLGVLRTENSFLLMDYGPHGGWHGHHDKLSFELYSHQKERFIDSGVTVYSLPISSEWFRTTLSHSTLMVGNQNQLEASGSLVHFYPFENGGFMTASVNNISDGVNSTRSFLLLDLNNDGIILLDLMNASSKDLQNYSSTYHGIDQIEIISNQTTRSVNVSNEHPWSYLDEAKEINIQNNSQFRWELGQNHSVDLFIPAQQDINTAFIAKAPNNPANGSHDLVLINATRELYDVEFASIIHSRTGDSAEVSSYSFNRVNESYVVDIQFDNGRNISLDLILSELLINVSDILPEKVETLPLETNETDLEEQEMGEVNHATAPCGSECERETNKGNSDQQQSIEAEGADDEVGESMFKYIVFFIYVNLGVLGFLICGPLIGVNPGGIEYLLEGSSLSYFYEIGGVRLVLFAFIAPLIPIILFSEDWLFLIYLFLYIPAPR